MDSQDSSIFYIAVETLGTNALPIVDIRDDLLITTGRNLEKYIEGDNLSFYWEYDNNPPLITFSSLQQKNYTRSNDPSFVDLLITSSKPLDSSFNSDIYSVPNGVSKGT